jgi:hypothetical protein
MNHNLFINLPTCRDREDRDRGGCSRGGDRGGGNSSAGANPVRDTLVDEFRSTYGKSRQWGLCDLLGHVVAFCQDQHGSRFIQQRLEVMIRIKCRWET